MPQKYTITAALIYANGPIHIGHLAGCYIPADIYARYLRLAGHDVAFVSGTDEHGVPITIRAKKEGLTPQQVVDKYYGQIKQSFADFGISFDVYSRTSLPVHHQTSQDFFTTLYNKNAFVEEVSEQYFDESAQQFLADRYIVGECPVCANLNAYGDQCERCGTALSPLELKNPRSMLSGATPILKATKNWYLPLDKMQPDIEAYVNSHKEWKVNVFGQCQSWLKDGLRPRAMTRDLDWGVKVPLPDSDGKVLYVWFDAPIGYISATKDWLIQKNGTDSGWQNYWQDPERKLVHFIGKDNIVFHCIIFPAMLMAHGGYTLADNVPANEFMNLEGDKISTSRNWAVWLHEYLQEFPDKQDVLRYVLAANAPETKDNDFTWKDFQTRNNSELVAIFGNFVNRAIVLTHKFCDGKVPPLGELTDIDRIALDTLAELPAKIGQSIEQYRFREALASVMDMARLGNKYLADTQPWHAIKTDPERVNTILNVSLQIVEKLATVCEPFMPFTADKIRKQLDISQESWVESHGSNLFTQNSKLKTQNPIGEGFLLFEKIEDSTIEAQIQKLQNSKLMNELETKKIADIKPEITFDDFGKMDIRVGTIVAAENVLKSKKLLKLSVADGHETRTILSGIAEYFKAEEVVGKQVCFLANLAPRQIMGQTSQGMILMAEDRDGSLAFVQPSKTVWDGAGVN